MLWSSSMLRYWRSFFFLCTDVHLLSMRYTGTEYPHKITWGLTLEIPGIVSCTKKLLSMVITGSACVISDIEIKQFFFHVQQGHTTHAQNEHSLLSGMIFPVKKKKKRKNINSLLIDITSLEINDLKTSLLCEKYHPDINDRNVTSSTNRALSTSSSLHFLK